LIDVDVSLSVPKNPEGKVIGSIGVIRDITERKKAERESKETMEIRSQFISTVSHELRTPLTSMKEAITIVSDEVTGKINKDQKHFLDIAKRNIERLSRLIDEVLDFQKLSANKMKFHMQDNDIREVVKDAYHTVAPYAKKKGVNLSIELDGNLLKPGLIMTE
jgi:signal transduction histidine kinase